MVPPSRGRPRASVFRVSVPPWGQMVTLLFAFKLVSFGLIACFVQVLTSQGLPVMTAVFAAAAVATCAGIGGRLALPRRRGYQLR